jgi:hypothetical protein
VRYSFQQRHEEFNNSAPFEQISLTQGLVNQPKFKVIHFPAIYFVMKGKVVLPKQRILRDIDPVGTLFTHF